MNADASRSPSKSIGPGKTCIYCGCKIAKMGKGEHIVQDALGCTLRIKRVCRECNNKMSEIDTELVSKSPLGTLAWDVLGRGTQETWGYDQERDLALEGHVLLGYEAPVLWPQVVFEAKAPVFYADLEELHQIGVNRYFESFFRHLTKARDTLRNGTKRPRWLWDRVRIPPRRGCFPPRVYTRHTFDEFDGRMHFQCRYLEAMDKNRVLWLLDNRKPVKRRFKVKETRGTVDTETQYSSRPRHILRALVKIGINLLEHVCKKTPVDILTFRQAIAFVRYDKGHAPSPTHSGFALNKDVQRLECPANAHKFRLTYAGNWRLDCAFFGGRMGATVGFPGPNRESWTRAEITAPMRSRHWRIETSPIIVPHKMRVSWTDMAKVIPSIPLKDPETRFRIERRRSR